MKNNDFSEIRTIDDEILNIEAQIKSLQDRILYFKELEKLFPSIMLSNNKTIVSSQMWNTFKSCDVYAKYGEIILTAYLSKTINKKTYKIYSNPKQFVIANFEHYYYNNHNNHEMIDYHKELKALGANDFLLKKIDIKLINLINKRKIKIINPPDYIKMLLTFS